MPPIRRYLRISKYSVLECRIYLDNPSDTRWLLNPRDHVLPRIFSAIRPLVLPKLREENEKAMTRKKGKPVKDVIVQDEFEVAIFLRESRTRHSLLTKHKTFEDSKVDAARNTSQADVNVDNTRIVPDSDSETGFDLHNIPQASADVVGDSQSEQSVDLNENQHAAEERRTRDQSPRGSDISVEEKKPRFRTNYEGFNIWGWVLCLLVTRRGEKALSKASTSGPSRQALMEEWMSTQAEADLDED